MRGGSGWAEVLSDNHSVVLVNPTPKPSNPEICLGVVAKSKQSRCATTNAPLRRLARPKDKGVLLFRCCKTVNKVFCTATTSRTVPMRPGILRYSTYLPYYMLSSLHWQCMYLLTCMCIHTLSTYYLFGTYLSCWSLQSFHPSRVHTLQRPSSIFFFSTKNSNNTKDSIQPN